MTAGPSGAAAQKKKDEAKTGNNMDSDRGIL